MTLLRVEGLRKRFNLEAGFFARFGRFVYAVNGVSFSIDEDESYGLVGESGCGKTTTARLLVGMYRNDGGSITWRDSIDVARLRGRELKNYREKVKYVFQDPARSLNPRMNIYEVLTSGYRWSSRWPGHDAARREAAAILEETGLSARDLERRPSEFSGGQRQRISIARGLIMQPELLVCDEVVSALDVSIQGQILNLLLDLKARRKLSFLFIAHDLKVASWFCDRIGVMYRGELLEEAPAENLYLTARHPYTRLLFRSALWGDGSISVDSNGSDSISADSIGDSNGTVDDRNAVSSYGSITMGDNNIAEWPVPGTAAVDSPEALASSGMAPFDAAPEAVAPSDAAPGGAGILRGEASTALAEIAGCAFAERCPYRTERCVRERPEWKTLDGGDRPHRVRCHQV